MQRTRDESKPDRVIERIPVVEFFEPPMCCPTGLCGPTPDQTLLDVQDMVRGLEAEGVAVSRYQPGSHPTTFTGNDDVMREIRAHGTASLPITRVNGRVVKTGAYPTIAEIRTELERGDR